MLDSKRSDIHGRRGQRVRRAMVLAVLTAALVLLFGPGDGVSGQVRQAAEPAAPPRPANPNDRNPGGLMDRAADSGSLVYVDDSFASVDKLRDAIRQASQGQSALALRTYQEIIDKFGQKLVYLSDNSYTSITDYVHEKQLQMPAVRDGMYDQLFGGDAKKAIDTAIENRDVATLIRVCDRYFPSAAAMKGLSQAADWYFERGEFSAAARTWEGLLVHPAATKMRSELLFRAAAAEALARNTENAKRLHDLLASESPDATGIISGREIKLLPKLDEVMAYPAWEGTVVSGDDWPAFGGGPSRSMLPAVNSTIGARLWGMSFTGEDRPPQSTNVNVNGILPRGALSGDTESLPSHPVLANGALFIHLGDRVMSLSANAGTKFWSYPQQIIPRMDPAATAQLRAAYGVDVRTSAHDSVSVFGDQVFAMLPAAMSNRTQQTSPYTGNTRVVCLSRDDGREIWSRSADEIPMDSKGNLVFVGSPMVTRQGVFQMARKAGDAAFSQLFMVRLDRETGAPTWSCYVCSTSTGNMNYPYNLLAGGAVAVPTLVDDILYVSTGQGADCAIDANVGRILWLRITDAAASQMTPSQISMRAMTLVASWKFNPPVVYGDKLITSDNGMSLRIYNRLTGQLLRKITSSDLDGMRIDVLAGMVGPHLILSGASNTSGGSNTVVRSINIDSILAASGGMGGGMGGGTGAGGGGAMAAPLSEWSTEVMAADAGLPQGRPFLTAKMYYMPCSQKLVRVDLAKGKIADGWVWPNTEKDQPGKPGNILVTSEQVVVVNDAEVAGYSKWETALANRQARIEAAPKDPLPYLDLAEISFRTSHFPLAQEMMKKSVDLANAMEATGSASGAKPATEVLGRLYRTNLNFGEQLLVKRDPENRDAARFYYEQCKASSRDPEQQAEWRLRLSELALKQGHPDEAATLYNEVLTDPALRVAAYREGDALSRAGVTAATKFALIKAKGAGIYKRFEDQATALLERSRGQKNLAGLQQVVDGYPNSDAAIAAGIQVAAAYREQKDWSKATKSLRWVADHTSGEFRARALADLASAYVAWDPKYYKAAIGYTYRGQSAAKDFSWTEAGKKMTFASLRQAISERGGIDIGGRLPALVPAGMDPIWSPQPAMTDTNALAKSSQLLAPVEQDTSLRPPNLLFMRRADNGQLRVYDSAAGADLKTGPFQLPQNQATVLLGCYRDTAVLLQSNMAIGVNLKSKEQMWSQRIDAATGGGAGRVVRQPQQGIIEGQQVIINGNVVNVINGPVMIVNGRLVESGYQVAQANAGLDADAMRMAAFSQLDKPNFTTARIVNDKLVIVSGSRVDAYDIATGKPAWRDRNEARISATLPDGQPTALLGNADVVVVQVESGEQGTPTFSVMDADTGKFRKQLTLKDERAMWRAVADDGTLFVVTDKAVAAYDLLSDTNLPLWRNTNLQTHYPGASALTLEGLIYVDSEANVICLSLDGGEQLWRIPEEQAVRLPLNASQGQIASLRSMTDGESIVFQSNEDIAVFRTVSGADQILWKGAKSDGPPRQGLQIAEGSVVEFAMGPVNNARNAVKFLVRDRHGGKLQATVPVTKNEEATEGPPIRVWQIVDGGLAFETNGNVQFLRLKGVEKNKPQGEAPH